MSDYGRPSTPSASHLRHKDPWLKAGQESTEHFKLHGSPLPLVWVLTEGGHIPPLAVPFSEDANGSTLYIARVRLEGAIYIGRIGHHLNGAVVTYAGKEHVVSKYEVLVCASELRWGFAPLEANGVLHQGTVVLAEQHRHAVASYSNVHVETFNTKLRFADIPRYVLSDHRREAALKKLLEIKTVILVDDSMSMSEGNLWHEAREALGGVVDMANQHGPKGIDLHFMHQDGYAENMHSKLEVSKLFEEILPVGEDTPTGTKLGQMIDCYLPLVESRESTHEPVYIIILTDGAATDYEELVQCIVSAAHRLERAGMREDRFRIQFVQIGTDEAAAEALRVLDDDLAGTYKIMDIVDTTPFNPADSAFDTEYILRSLFVVKNTTISNSTLLSPLRTVTTMGSPRLTATLGGKGRLASPATHSPSRLSRTLPRY